ncbi:MAG: hypothetical protein JXQ29_03910 [Planctomycetes bacterium]|nr:hypothetical protein [Planctomycetota bacterium]
MPHVTIEGALDLRAFSGEFIPVVEQLPWGLLRIRNVYLDARGRTLLFEALAMESGAGRSFLVRVETKRSDRHMVRLDPIVPVDRTRGVRSAVVWVARRLRDRNPGCAFGTTNLAELAGS